MTNALSFLPQCDQIVVLDEGRITEVGSYSELIDNDGSFAEFIRTYTSTEGDEEEDPSNYTEIDLNTNLYLQSSLALIEMC